MTYNADLGDRVLAQIRDHPETWKQDTWRCESGMCFAGWAFELSPQAGQWMPFTDPFAESRVRLPSGDTESVLTVAGELLGLDWFRAADMFDARNDLDRLERLHKHFANNPDDDSLPEDET